MIDQLRYTPEEARRIRPVAIFPTREVHVDQIAIRDWAQGAEEMGFEGALVYHHTARTDAEDGNNNYTVADPFHQPNIINTAFAMTTRTMNLMTGVLVLPMLQTPNVAADTAQIAALSGGRMHLGVGAGSNKQEYAAFGKADIFPQRGRRLEQQVDDLRTLWKGELVDHADDGTLLENPYGIRPLPGHTIPIWMGGWAKPVLDRVARQADGWMPMGNPIDVFQRIDYLRDRLVENDKDPMAFPIMSAMGRTHSLDGTEVRAATTPDDWGNAIQAAFEMGVSDVAHGTMRHGYGANVDAHLGELQEWMDIFILYQPPALEEDIFKKFGLDGDTPTFS